MKKAKKPAKKSNAKRTAKPVPVETALRYKVVELSNVDEGAIEHTVNEWVRQGWVFDGVQFAMRESSKRPAMAFVFFTRQAPVIDEADSYRSSAEADRHLRRLVDGANASSARQPTSDAWARLAELANDGLAGDDA